MDKIEAMELAAGLAGLVTGMESDLLENIAAYMLAGNLESDSAKWKLHKLAQLGKLHRKNVETIVSYGEAEKELLELTVKTAAVSAMNKAEPGFRKMVIEGLIKDAPSGSMEKSMTNILNMLRKQAKSDLNLVNTTMLKQADHAAQKAIRKSAALMNDQKFLDMLNKAAGSTVTGTESMTAAVSRCLKEMANEGIPGFIDKRGRKWTPEAYVNLCVRATVKNTETKALFERMGDFGLRLIQISSHIGARPKCAPYQGRLFSLDNQSGETTDVYGNKIPFAPFSSTSYGEPDGLFGINCGHSGYPFTAGISTQRFFPFDEEENSAQYKKLQKQRELERNVRAAKRECAMLKDGDKREFQKASVRLKQRSQKLKDYCEANDLTYQNERTSVLGYGRSEAGKVTAAYKRALKEKEDKLQQEALDNQKNRDILESKILSGELPLKLNIGHQNKHIKGSNGYIEGRSYLLIDADEAQNIVNTMHGTGFVAVKSSGQIKEIVELDRIVGVDVGLNDRVETPTNKITIHYSKKGTHIVPAFPGNK